MYCGDETGSFIGDVGSHTCRFGYGGEDNPKYVAPSYMAEIDNDDGGNSINMNRRYIPSSCYQGRLASQQLKPILRSAYWGQSDTMNNDEKNKQKQQLLATSPKIDPNAYLQQGDIIQNWDALERVWQTSFDILRVRDTKKHTLGGRSYLEDDTKEKTQEQQQQQQIQSSTVRADNNNDGSGKCIHPILAVTPGLTYHMGSNSDSNNNSTDAVTHPGSKYIAAIQREQQSRLTEFLMETMEAPAVFLAPTPMLSSFSCGRQTALVVDMGAGGCRVTPVVDGLILKHAQRRNGRGGDWLGNIQWRALLEEKVVFRPRYQLRKAVSAMATKSPYFYRWAMQDLMYEIRTSSPHVKLAPWCIDETVPFLSSPAMTTASCSPSSKASSPPASPAHSDNNSNNDEEDDEKGKASKENSDDAMDVDDNDDAVTSDVAAAAKDVSNSAVPTATYELPDGTHIDLTSKMGKDLCRVPELFFTDDVPFVNEPLGVLRQHHTLSDLPLHKLIFSSLTAVGDADIRKDLANNIILTGGSSLYANMEQRLSLEVPRMVPSAYKCRVIASRVSVERSCSAWIGASILTSLGSFQQLWLSRTEYEEYGTTLSIQRFP